MRCIELSSTSSIVLAAASAICPEPSQLCVNPAILAIQSATCVAQHMLSIIMPRTRGLLPQWRLDAMIKGVVIAGDGV